MKISELLEQKDKLPNVPEVVKELINKLSDENARYDEIAAKVSKDPTLSVKILRMVNSAYYGLSRKVNSIEEAVVMIGFERLKVLVISSGLTSSVAAEVEGLDIRRFWNESFEIGEICKVIAAKTDADPSVAFTAGIISNMGQLLLHLTAPNRAKAIQTAVDEGENREEAEVSRLTFSSAQAGAALMEMWKLPKELCMAVLQQNKPLAHEPPNQLSAIIYLSKQLMRARKKGATAQQLTDTISLPISALAGINGGLGDLTQKIFEMETVNIM